MKRKPIKLFGSKSCHKTQYYVSLLESYNLDFIFLDVLDNEQYAQELRSLFLTKKLNFPTLLIGDKKLRNPHSEELKKWLTKKEYNQIKYCGKIN